MVGHAAGAHAEHGALGGVGGHSCRTEVATQVCLHATMRPGRGEKSLTCPCMPSLYKSTRPKLPLTCPRLDRNAGILGPGNAHKHARLGRLGHVQAGTSAQRLARSLKHQPGGGRTFVGTRGQLATAQQGGAMLRLPQPDTKCRNVQCGADACRPTPAQTACAPPCAHLCCGSMAAASAADRP